MKDNLFNVTYFNHKGARHRMPNQVSLQELAEKIEDTEAPAKDLLLWIKFAEFGNNSTDKGSLRWDGNVTAITGCELDYDLGIVPFEQAVACLRAANVACIVHTSPSHKPDTPRWRVLAPTSKPLPKDARTALVARINGVLGGVAAAESFTLSQAYYIGHLTGSTTHKVELIDGEYIDLCGGLDAGAIGKNGHHTPANGHDPEPANIEELTRRIMSGESLHPSVGPIAGSYAARGVPVEACLDYVALAFTAAHQPRYGNRWEEVKSYVQWVYAKEEAKRATTAKETITPKLSFLRGDQITMTAVEWLWPGRFALGKLGVIAGLPDEGKGQIICDIVSRVSRGDKWPLNEGQAPLGNIIFLSAEDDLADTVTPRLAAAGTDMSRVYFLQMVRQDKNGDRMFSFASDLPLLKEMIAQIKDVALIIVDPMSAYLGTDVDTFRANQVRAILSPLTDITQENQTAIIAIMHFNKKIDVTNALLRVSDTLAFGAHARHVYAVVDDPDNERKIFFRAKNNLAVSKDKAMGYRFLSKMVGHDHKTGKEIIAPYIVWDPEYIDITAAEAMAAATSSNKSPTARDEAKKFLDDLLREGPVPVNQIMEHAKANGITERTLIRAKGELGITAHKDGPDGEWRWHPPEPGWKNDGGRRRRYGDD